ncbi:response regulator [Mangrovibacterium marinum]|uniref:Response regulator receiver domain-containing protein n=1 Tax=Mangrovibacterium marinum TaxID=1639118 RepID=A0A2T5C5U5_9BACT|nr:response regulator [Mangrovibacterium marinum]PTN10276.1 response regulator receiver domain-containing protein [Mangrovibacterium marinum]
MKILVVDDNPINQKFVQLSLRNAHVIETANDGEEAVIMASRNIYDLIIMDLWMPIMDGAEATLRIRQIDQENNRKTPILVFTTSNMENDRTRCLEYGANEYLVKPVRAATLMEKVSYFSNQGSASFS